MFMMELPQRDGWESPMVGYTHLKQKQNACISAWATGTCTENNASSLFLRNWRFKILKYNKCEWFIISKSGRRGYSQHSPRYRQETHILLSWLVQWATVSGKHTIYRRFKTVQTVHLQAANNGKHNLLRKMRNKIIFKTTRLNDSRECIQ
jgi:hypothetical protein